MIESFAQLFEESLNAVETRQGSIVKGTVVAIENGFVLVDAGLKSESAIPAEEFKNAMGELEINVGDSVDVALDSIEDGFGETKLSREKAKRDACLDELIKLGVAAEDITLVTVPGALEIPLALQTLAMSEDEDFDALIALGAVIRGETYHFELVSNESGAGVTRVGLDTGVPIANAILTTETDEQAEARMEVKGREAARVAVEMVNLNKSFFE